jgi:hypothetical protein
MVSNTLFRFLAGVIMAGVKSNSVYFPEGKCCTVGKCSDSHQGTKN